MKSGKNKENEKRREEKKKNKNEDARVLNERTITSAGEDKKRTDLGLLAR